MRLLVSTVVGITAALATIFALAGTDAVAAPSPVIVIVMENHERSSIEGSADADYLKSFEAAGRSFTHYYAVSHPSLPNYLAIASGSTKGKAGSDTISVGQIAGANLFSQLQANGISWGVYMESMPSACYGGTSSGQYVLRHNPALPFANIWNKPKRCAKVVPYTQFNVNALPSVSFVVPNLCNDMHDCSIATGDNWLQARVPAMLAAGAEVVITFDEGSTSTNGGGNVYMAADGPGIGSSVNTATFSHYSLIAGLEARFGLAKLNSAKTVTPLPI
jgi:hypothetical protein